MTSPVDMSSIRRPLARLGLFTGLVGAPLAAAYRFALIYRVRAGYPRRRPPTVSPADLGLPFVDLSVPSSAAALPGWFIPARDGAPGPGVVIVHGWESNRSRTLPHAEVLHAAGFHVLTFDVRGHGANPPERLPISVGEFAADAEAALAALSARAEVTAVAVLGHSLGGVGAIIAAARAGDRCTALVSLSAPADPRRLTRQTFRLAALPIPEPFATPLAELTTRVYLRPRGHAVRALSASRAITRYEGPILLVHGSADAVVPVSHLERLARAARGGGARRVETLIVEGGQHSWLHEHESYRRAVAAFLADAFGGPLSPTEAADRAAAVPAPRLAEADEAFSALGIAKLEGPPA
ncbi:MAG: alpha/beta hydrolase family protein [Candidatus Limnocylindrales bacterium]